MPFSFASDYERLPPGMFTWEEPTPVAAPRWLVTNKALGVFLGLTSDDICSPEALAYFSGNAIPHGARPAALAYAGHQFGHLVPRLGDGRALLLGELKGKDGRLYDVQLKGSGPTQYSRGGDGRAAIGPVLREYLVSEAMAALGVPTTRSLCAVATGERVFRDTVLPGAILTRVATSHLRIGSFEFAALTQKRPLLQSLTEFAVGRLYPEAKPKGEPDGELALRLLDAVIAAQASLVAQWMGLGFVHGVMNTDNTSIAGETIDYGPCAFLDTFSPARVFSSIDRGGRYAYANQPRCALWNLARLAESLLPLLSQDLARADEESRVAQLLNDRLGRFDGLYAAAYLRNFRRKLGLESEQADDRLLVDRLLAVMAEQEVDFTLLFRRLADVVEGEDLSPVTGLCRAPQPMTDWLTTWRQRLAAEGRDQETVAREMRVTNPLFIPRNHRVEEALAAAATGDMGPFHRLHQVLSRPYEDQPEAQDLALPPGPEQWEYRTFCGT